MFTVPYIVHTVRYIVYHIQCTLYSLQCTLYSIYCTEIGVECTGSVHKNFYDDMDMTNTTNNLTVLPFYNQRVHAYLTCLSSWKLDVMRVLYVCSTYDINYGLLVIGS